MSSIKKYFSLISAFFIMLCLGNIYAWSIFAYELKNKYFFSDFQTQLIFGLIIIFFPISMLFVNFFKNQHPKFLCRCSAISLFSGYLIAGLSKGNFFIILFSLGILASFGIGLGYITCLKTPVQCFPQNKGLVSGVVTAGFGLSSVILPYLFYLLKSLGIEVLEILIILGCSYGVIVYLLASGMIEVKNISNHEINQNLRKKISSMFLDIKPLLHNKIFKMSFVGQFLGTFAGLLVIGNMKSIGSLLIENKSVILFGISLFSFCNFLGRITWGLISDYKNNYLTIFCALFLQAIAIFLLFFLRLNNFSFLILSGVTGFCFGANFVLFAKETATQFGVERLSSVYPYIFISYGIAGVFGPVSGGILFDIFKTYSQGLVLASMSSLVGSSIFFIYYKSKQDKHFKTY